MQERAEAPDLLVGEVGLVFLDRTEDVRDEVVGPVALLPDHELLPVLLHLPVRLQRGRAREVGAAERVEVPLEEELLVLDREPHELAHDDRRHELREAGAWRRRGRRP